MWLPGRMPAYSVLLLRLLPLFTLLFLWQAASTVAGGCRDEESRSCEAICLPNSYNSYNINNSNNNDSKSTSIATTAYDDDKYTCSIRALVLLPDDDMYEASLRRVLPILSVAEQWVHSTQLIPPHIKFEWMPQDDKCDASYAVIKAMDGVVKNCAHVMFGPVCDYPLASVSRITKYFNGHGTPLISVGGSTFNFEKQKTSCADEFYMLLRTGLLSFETISLFTIDIMKKYNWSRSIFFYDRNGQQNVAGLHTCFLMMNSLGEQMRKDNITFAQYSLNMKLNNRTEEMQREIGNKQSIVIMCADPQSIRQIMLTAEELNMIDSGEYVFINIELFSRVPHITSQPWFDKNDTAENNARAHKAYTAMLTVTPKQPDDDEYTRVSNEIKAIAAAKYNYTFHENEPISAFVTSFFDGVLLYANALNESIREDPTILTRPINGMDMVRRMWNRSFKGITGNVTIDANGDRISAYSLLDMNPKTGRFEIVANFLHNHLEYVPGKVIHWAGDRQEPPPDKPTCGYDGSLCPDNSLPGYAILSIILGVVVLMMMVCFFFGYRHYKSEAEINSMAWKVSLDDVFFPDSGGRCFRGSFHSLVKQNSQLTLMSEDMVSFSGDRQIFIPIGIYKGCKVAIKLIDEQNVNWTRSLMLELKRMKDLQHDHLVKFYGACLDTSKSFLLTEYCPKGSLQDILENEQFQLDSMFKMSLMHDIVRGMQFIHNSDIKTHGNLKSSNCVVDSRFVLKITDFGLHSLRRSQQDQDNDVENCNSHAYWSKLLWTAPELLKLGNNRPPEGTQKGDVYSFGIIVHEISTRQGAFYLGKCEQEKSPQEIIALVKGYPQITQQPFRPCIDNEYETTPEIRNIMTKCWSEEPTERPDFNALKTTIRKINKDNETGNIVDNLLKRMEQYANNLEELVEERTQDYLEEKKKCEKLLYQLLPQSVAAQLISGQPVIAETFDQVTIYFSDIVGFTAISAESTPMQVVQFLNDLYTCFDSIVENFDVYKVETIGDAYMVVSGLPIRNGNQHSREIARLALALLEAVHNFRIHHRPNDKLKLRIGLHTGACVAGVVGMKMPRYCLFGDTVNTASRMESNGEALKIHISEKTKLALDEWGTFITTRRGYVPMKGKGEMLTYWLEGEVPKPESPIMNSKMLISRRSSLKQTPKYGQGRPHLEPQHSAVFSPNHQLHHQLSINISREASRQNSPNLRIKRKISSSSPKLNAGDVKTEDFNYYLESAKPLQKERHLQLSRLQNDIYSSRSLREPSKENWELANFRLPLSGALKNHNNNHLKNSYSQLPPSHSNSNLSGILQPCPRMKLKTSATIPTLTTPARSTDTDNSGLFSGNRIKFPNHSFEQPANNKILLENHRTNLQEVESVGDEEEEREADENYDDDEEEEEEDLHPFKKLIDNESNSKLQLLNNSNAATVICPPTHYNVNCNGSASTVSGVNVGNASVVNASASNNYNNIVKANNVKNLKLLCKNATNSRTEECNVTTNGNATGSGTLPVVVVGGSNNAVTQPLLAKINS